jgi:7-cyano-7-deazaguanine synthase
MGKKAVVLLSGGLDSATTLAEAKALGFDVFALTVRYGQRHAIEIDAARRVAVAMGVVMHVEQAIDLRAFGGSVLTDGAMAVPKDRGADAINEGISVTYVPARNTIFLSLALAWAETLEAFDIFIGANCADHRGFPDCRPDYFRAFTALANVATRSGVEGRTAFQIHTPLLMLTKEEVIKRGLSLGVNYGLTHTCYDPLPDGSGCGRCDSCIVRLGAFRKLGLSDPIRYDPKVGQP